MKKSEITVGGLYRAKVSGKIVTVKVEAIRQRETYAGTDYGGYSKYRDTTVYDVLNTATGRRTTFRSAAKFRGIAITDAQRAERRRQYVEHVHALRNVRELHAQY